MCIEVIQKRRTGVEAIAHVGSDRAGGGAEKRSPKRSKNRLHIVRSPKLIRHFICISPRCRCPCRQTLSTHKVLRQTRDPMWVVGIGARTASVKLIDPPLYFLTYIPTAQMAPRQWHQQRLGRATTTAVAMSKAEIKR